MTVTTAVFINTSESVIPSIRTTLALVSCTDFNVTKPSVKPFNVSALALLTALVTVIAASEMSTSELFKASNADTSANVSSRISTVTVPVVLLFKVSTSALFTLSVTLTAAAAIVTSEVVSPSIRRIFAFVSSTLSRVT